MNTLKLCEAINFVISYLPNINIINIGFNNNFNIDNCRNAYIIVFLI